jgi:hypothetical protein
MDAEIREIETGSREEGEGEEETGRRKIFMCLRSCERSVTQLGQHVQGLRATITNANESLRTSVEVSTLIVGPVFDTQHVPIKIQSIRGRIESRSECCRVGIRLNSIRSNPSALVIEIAFDTSDSLKEVLRWLDSPMEVDDSGNWPILARIRQMFSHAICEFSALCIRHCATKEAIVHVEQAETEETAAWLHKPASRAIFKEPISGKDRYIYALHMFQSGLETLPVAVVDLFVYCRAYDAANA